MSVNRMSPPSCIMSLMDVFGRSLPLSFVESGGYCSERRFPVFIDCTSGWLTFVHSGSVLCFILYSPCLAMFRFILIMLPHRLYASLKYNSVSAVRCLFPSACRLPGPYFFSDWYPEEHANLRLPSLATCARKEKVDVIFFRLCLHRNEHPL